MGERFADVVGVGFGCVSAKGLGMRVAGEFARLFICRKGERPFSAERKRGAVVELIC